MESKMEKGFMDQIDFLTIIKDILRNWWVILILSVSVSLFANVWVRYNWQPQYTTTSTFVVTARGMNSSVFQNLSYAQNLAEQFSQILDSNVLKNRVADELGMDSFTAQTSAQIVPETNLMTLTVTADSALDAYRVMNSIMNNYGSVSDYVLDRVILEVIQQPQIPMAVSNPLNTESVMKRCFLISAAVLAVAFGIFSYLKDTVKNEKEVSDKIDARHLGTIYHERKAKSLREIRKMKSFSMLILNPLLSFRFVESNRMTASRVRSHMDKRGAKTLLLTSVMENEGKSTVAANLALSLAQENKNVLLIDCDFRKPAQYLIFGVPEKETIDLPGILKNKSGLGSLIKKRKDCGLYTIFNSVPSDSMEELLENGMFQYILDFCRDKMDYIILDTSPMALVADAEELAQMADASVLVVKQDMVLARDINDAVDILNNTNGRVLGCIFNDVMTGLSPAAGRYGYGGHYGKRTE